MVAGVPLTYTEELGNEICLKLAISNKGIARLCKENPHWPCKQTIFEWRIKVKEFGERYAKAKQDQIEALVDEIIDISDDTAHDTLTNEKGNDICNSEWINRSRLRIDTRKWLASKLAPKIYGEKLESKIDHTVTPHEDWTKILK